MESGYQSELAGHRHAPSQDCQDDISNLALAKKLKKGKNINGERFIM
jgi:hypothetical protein